MTQSDVAAELFTEPEPSTALAVIEEMADDLLFTPGAVTDAQLEAGRQWYLTEARKYQDVSTEKARTELKRFARPLQKLRTGIEARAKELTGATKRKIAAIDAEKRRLVAIVGGIEEQVLSPLQTWEAEENARKQRLAGIVTRLAECGQWLYTSIEPIEAAITELESFDVSAMQEYRAGAESAIAASLKVLKPELERRKQAEAQAAELAGLRAAAAKRAEQDRIAALTTEAVEAERKRAAAQAAAEFAEMEKRAADEAHRQQVHAEIRAAIDGIGTGSMPGDWIDSIIRAIASGEIPHLTITY
jgi:colicin import membrane protein